MISPQLRSELLQYLEYIHEQTEEKTIKKPVSETELVLGALACLQEESGELACEVRKFTKMNFNQSKVDNFLPEHLAEELADVLIVTLLLAKRLGYTSLDQAIAAKVHKNNKRGY